MSEIEANTDQTQNDPKQDMALRANFRQYNSPFLQLMIPLLVTRYVWLAAEDINPLNFLNKPDPAKAADFKPWVKPSAMGYVRRNFAALGMGATILSLIGFYSQRTAHDIKAVYREAVAYELEKDPKAVTWHDVFFKSQNDALIGTRSAFMERTAVRLGVGSAFLMPWHMIRDWRNAKPKYDANANAGVGAMGVYLSLFEGFMRSPSVFDNEQKMVNRGITHKDANDQIRAEDIKSVLQLQRQRHVKNYRWPKPNTPEGEREKRMAERICELMNQTYGNLPRKEEAAMTLGKFNFLLGFGMLDCPPLSAGFVELANRSKDMKDVKDVARRIFAGQDAAQAFGEHGVDIVALENKPVASQGPAPSFVERLGQQVDKSKNQPNRFDIG